MGRIARLRGRGPSVALAVGLLALGGCGDGPGPGADGVSVVATTTQVADLARNVGGERIAVDQILAPNADPHAYEPRPSDAAAIADAALVLRSGGEVDDWLADLIEGAGGDRPVIELADRLGEVGDRATDPHWWQDPRRAAAAVAAIRAALVEVDPRGRMVYERNARAYIGRLSRLDSRVASCIARIPPPDRELVSTHDALGAFAERYELEQVGEVLESRSTQAQPSSKAIGALVEEIEDRKVRAIFPESSADPAVEEAVARESGATLGAALWVDSLGPEGSNAATYIESIEANTEAIVDGLTGGSEYCRPSA